ncbi:hypothetical protein Ciccas_005111 [Cichlidogyrus casuarinus]|uniref:Uncharacterized protein n=1 Tax=Cichlidogyrus casuarinus TaxID=1844966 RepID=A0ABD2Q9T9_9PLAT
MKGIVILLVCWNVFATVWCAKWIHPVTVNSSSIRFPCRDEIYPFNVTNTGIFAKVYWRLPKSMGSILLRPGQKVPQAEVETNYDLVIHKEFVPQLATLYGEYICAGLATPNSSSVWFYLKWGYGIYDHPVMRQGHALERYHEKFLTGGLALLVYICLVLGFKLTIKCSKKFQPESPKEPTPDLVQKEHFITFYSPHGMITRL